jgi:hypothetical protein
MSKTTENFFALDVNFYTYEILLPDLPEIFLSKIMGTIEDEQPTSSESELAQSYTIEIKDKDRSAFDSSETKLDPTERKQQWANRDRSKSLTTLEVIEPVQLEQVIHNPAPNPDDQFGWDVAAVGDRVLAGTPFDDTGATDSGAVYLFDSTTGEVLLTINNPTPAKGDNFGVEVAALGEQILVGAPADSTGARKAGSAYLFDSVTGQLLLTINNPEPNAADNFGMALAGLEDKIIVGAPSDDPNGIAGAGSIYVFDSITGELLLTINNPEPEAGDNFGRSVAALGDDILVGVPFDGSGSINTGSVYLFDGITGELKLTIRNPQPSSDNLDSFGFAIAAVGNNILIGSRDSDDPDTGTKNAGIAYLYDGTTGELLLTLQNPDPRIGESFGRSVAAVGNDILIGSRYRNATASDGTVLIKSGAAYLFDGTTGDLLQTIANPDPETGDRFAHALAGAEGNKAIISAIYDDADNVISNSGSSYVYLIDRAGNAPDSARDLGQLDTITTPQTFVDGVGADDIQDFYRFELLSSSNFTLALEGLSADANVLVQNETGFVVASSLNSGSASEFIDTILDPGLYHVVVLSNDNVDTNYQLTLSAQVLPSLASKTLSSKLSSSSGSTGQNLATVPFVFETKLTASDAASSDWFGIQLDLTEDGNKILVGASGNDDNGPQSGSAYIFERVNGTWQETKLTPSDGTTEDFFSGVLQIQDNTAVIGALLDDDKGTDSGSDYIFEKINGVWTQTVKLNASDGRAGDGFGFPSLSLDDNTLMVGSPFDNDPGLLNAGSVYVFQKIGGIWTETDKLFASDREGNDQFGRYIQLEGNTAIIGSTYGDGAQEDAGAVYVFELIDGEWLQTAKLTASDGQTQDLFGRVAKLDGDSIIIGARANNGNQGASYIFEKIDGVWQQTAKLTASDGAINDLFGHSVDIQDDLAVVSARYDDDKGINSGSVYLYQKIDGIWTQVYKLVPSDGRGGDIFGERIELEGNTLIVGAYLDDEQVFNSGSVYIYHLDRSGNSLAEARQLQVFEALLPPDGAGNTRQTARNLGTLDDPTPQTFFDGVGAADLRDFYRFEILNESSFELDLEGLSANADVILQDEAGRIVGSSRNLGNTPESISRKLDSGTYYVLIRSTDRIDTTYTLTLSAQTATIDRIVSDPTVSLPDPEFDQSGDWVNWEDENNNLWIAPVDPTGDFILEEAAIVDTGLAPYGTIRNGPEWAFGRDGSRVVYTKIVNDRFVIAQAQFNGSTWVAELLTDEVGDLVPGRNPFGSLDPQGESPLVSYGQSWREIDDPSVGGILPGNRSRWVQGERSILQFIVVDGVEQFFKYQVDTEELTQLTFDNTDKQIDSFMWNAPEFDNDQVFFVQEIVPLGGPSVPKQATQLGIYRNIDGTWTRINTIPSPAPELPLINSPELAVYNGKSYISLVLAKQAPNGDFLLDGSEEIWLVGIDPEEPFSRQIVSGGEAILKKDPEILVTETGTYIYYTDRSTDGILLVRQADTGLGAPVAAASSSLSLQATPTALPADGAGNTRQSARDLGTLDDPTPQTFFDGVGATDLKDFYRFEILNTSNFELSLEGLSANANVFLQDEAGNTLVSSLNRGTASESIATTLNSGTYYVLVRSADRIDTTYELTLSATAEFVVNDDVVSDPSKSFDDPEFNGVDNLVTWQEGTDLWVAPVNPQTGDFILTEAELIDTGLALVSGPVGSGYTANGPEWVLSTSGSEIVYTKLIDGAWWMGRAQWNGSEWVTDILPESQDSYFPFGTRNPSDEVPLISYIKGVPNGDRFQGLFWRELDDPSVGGAIKVNGRSPNFGHWVGGEQSITTIAPVDNIVQVFKYDLATNSATQLTFDSVPKTEARMWQAPEFGGELVFFTGERTDPNSNKQTQLGIYREIDGEWTKIKTIKPPTDLPFIHSAEYFVYNNKSYITLLTTNAIRPSYIDGLTGAEVWIAGIEPEFDFYRQVSGSETIVRNDPESIVTDEGAFVYYTELIGGGNRVIHRADTGLGSPSILNSLDLATNSTNILGGSEVSAEAFF